jgi:hypothetical protein
MSNFYNILRTKTVMSCILILAILISIIPISSLALPAIDTILTPEIEAISIDSNTALKEVIENLNQVDPHKPTITKLHKKSKGEITTMSNDKTQGSSTLNVSINSNKTISMDNGRNKINIKVDNHGDNSTSDTKLIDNKVIYQGTKVDTIVEAVDGGIRQTINIKDSSAPKSYNFPIELKQGEAIRINKDGSANIINSKQESITSMLKPWARDANNQELSTHYTVDNNLLRQHITTNSMIRYPVKADPIFCGRVWNSLKWEDRKNEGGYTLSISPNWCGRQLTSELWRAWDVYKDIANNAPYDNQ